MPDEISFVVASKEQRSKTPRQLEMFEMMSSCEKAMDWGVSSDT